MIPNPQTSRGFLDLTTVAVTTGSHHATGAWLTAPVGFNQFVLQDYAVANAPIFNEGQNIITSLPAADEVIVNVRNVGTAFPVVGGKPIVVQFQWSDGDGSSHYEMAMDHAPASAITSALVAGATDGTGNPLQVRRYQTDVAEFQIELNEGRAFRLPVKAAFLLVGVAALGAPGATQVVMMQLIPRTVGVAR